MSGLEINMHKCEMFIVGEISEVERKMEEMRCGVGDIPTNYLGLFMGPKYKSVRAWDLVV